MSNILIVASHPDDETLGCGGTIHKHTRNGDNVYVLVLSSGVGSRNISESKNARVSSMINAFNILGVANYNNLDLPDNKFDMIPLLQIVKYIEVMIEDRKPSIIYTHSKHCLNQDHRRTHEATIIAIRNKLFIEQVYCYEVLSSTDVSLGLNGSFEPNSFTCLEEEDIDAKVKALECYESELSISRNGSNLKTLSIYRGNQVGFENAEAFEIIRKINSIQISGT